MKAAQVGTYAGASLPCRLPLDRRIAECASLGPQELGHSPALLMVVLIVPFVLLQIGNPVFEVGRVIGGYNDPGFVVLLVFLFLSWHDCLMI